MFSDLSSSLGFTCHGSVTVTKVRHKERVNIQVMVFLRWVRFLVVEVMWMRQHVIVNMDETQLASVKKHGTGMISGRKQNVQITGEPFVMQRTGTTPKLRTWLSFQILRSCNRFCLRSFCHGIRNTLFRRRRCFTAMLGLGILSNSGTAPGEPPRLGS